jgi:hypothetical protein
MAIFSRLPPPSSPPALPEDAPEPLRKALKVGKFTHRWESRAELEQWMGQERESNYAFVRQYIKPGSGTTYSRHVCHRAAAGGSSKRHHTKPKPEPAPGKRGAASRDAQHIGCPVVLNIREFTGSSIILGSYEGEHNHQLGGHNVEYERIAPKTWEKMKSMIQKGMSPEAIVRDHLPDNGHYVS